MTEDEEEDLWEERRALAHDRHRPVTPRCCAAVQDQTAVVMDSELDGTDPQWVLRLRHNSDYPPTTRVPDRPKFCPYCGEGLPGFELRVPPPAPLCVTDQYGDYCETCGERTTNCCCYWPWAVWKVKEKYE